MSTQITTHLKTTASAELDKQVKVELDKIDPSLEKVNAVLKPKKDEDVK